MPTPGKAVERIKGLYRFQGVAKFDLQPGFLSLPDSPPHRIIEALEQGLSSDFQINPMTMKRHGRRRSRPIRTAGPAFQITPAVFAALVQGGAVLLLAAFVSNAQRRAEITERQRNAPATGQPARHFHDRKQLHHSPLAEPAEIKGTVAVSLVEHSRPSRPVKKTALWMMG